MSSPTNIIVIVTSPGTPIDVDAAAVVHGQKWLKPDERRWHTDKALAAFFSDIHSRIIDGQEGAIATWGYAGNHISEDIFMDAVRPFFKALIEHEGYTRATVFFQPADSNVSGHYAIDGVGEKHYSAHGFSFDVELDRLL